MVAPVVPPLTTPEGIEISKAYQFIPGVDIPGENQAREDAARMREQLYDDTGPVLEAPLRLADLAVGPPETQTEATAMAAGEAGSVVLAPAAKLGSRFVDDAGQFVGRVTKLGDDAAQAGSRQADELVQPVVKVGDEGWSTGTKLAAGGGAGVAGASLLWPDETREFTEAGAERASQGFAGLLSGGLQGLFSGTTDAAKKAPLGFAILAVVAIGALLAWLGMIGGDG